MLLERLIFREFEETDVAFDGAIGHVLLPHMLEELHAVVGFEPAEEALHSVSDGRKADVSIRGIIGRVLF